MNPRVATAVVAAFLLYAVYSWMSTPIGTESFVTKPSVRASEPLIVAEPRIVTPAGPGSPNEKAPEESIIVPPEQPYDSQEESYESAEHPNRLRYPERLYGPGLETSDKQSAIDSGIASNSHQATMNAYQVFGPEFAQNGGAFMENGVVANDSSIETGYSSI
jgi:hypothetical protein